MNSHYALCRSVGSGIPFVLEDGGGAVTVLLQPMRMVDWGVLEQMILLERKKAIIIEDLTPEMAEYLKETIRRDRSVQLDDLFDYAATLTGSPWRLWLSLRQVYSYDQCCRWIQQLRAKGRLGEYLTVASQIDGLDIFAALDWPVIPYQKELQAIRGKKKEEDRSIDWKLHVSGMAEACGISPREFGELTFHQASILLWDREALSGKVKISSEEARNLAQSRKALKFYEEKKAAQKNSVSESTGSTTDSPP